MAEQKFELKQLVEPTERARKQSLKAGGPYFVSAVYQVAPGEVDLAGHSQRIRVFDPRIPGWESEQITGFHFQLAPAPAEPLRLLHWQWSRFAGWGIPTKMTDPTSITEAEYQLQCQLDTGRPYYELRPV